MHLSTTQTRALSTVMRLLAEADDADALRGDLALPMLDLLQADTYVSFTWNTDAQRFDRVKALNMSLDGGRQVSVMADIRQTRVIGSRKSVAIFRRSRCSGSYPPQPTAPAVSALLRYAGTVVKALRRLAWASPRSGVLVNQSSKISRASSFSSQ